MAGFGSCVAALAALTCLQIGSAGGATVLPPNTIHRGLIEGKSYYTNNDTRDWYEASAFCDDPGLNLATVKTVEQHNFWVSKHPLLGLRLQYWTAGSDFDATTNFVWPGGRKVSCFQAFEPANSLAFIAYTPTIGVLASSPNAVKWRVMCESR